MKQPLDGVARGFGGVPAPPRGGPPEGGWGQLFHFPAGVLLEPVVVPSFRRAIAQTRPSARLVGDVVLEIALGGRPPAGRPGTGRVPDLGQVPQLDPRIVTRGLVAVIAGLRGDRLKRHHQVRLPAGPGRESPVPVSARRAVLVRGREGEPRPVSVPGPTRRITSVRRAGF